MSDLEGACESYIAREPVSYKKKLFRAFLNMTREEIEAMSWQDYVDNAVVLQSVLMLWHAPFQKSK